MRQPRSRFHLAVCLAVLLATCFASAARAETLGQVRLEVDDLANQPISSIQVGSDFVLKGYVQDVRSPAPPNGGVFAAFLDIPFNSSLASAAGSIVVDGFFPLFAGSSNLTGNLLQVGGASISPIAPGQAEQLLFSFTLHADQPGQIIFTPSLDTSTGHDFLIYGQNESVTADQVTFLSASLQIVPEPSALILAAVGAAGAVWLGLRGRARRD